jgi:2-hydroxy-6-oxonona-2,4-dienedioate hydrolase
MTSSIWLDLLETDFRQTFFDVDGVRTRAIEAGSGEPLIFLHGIGGHAEAYAKNIAAHAKHFHVYSLDMIGHGLTAGPDIGYDLRTFSTHLGNFIDVIGARQVMLSGESLGAMVATLYTVENSNRVSKLILNTGMIAPRSETGMKQMRDLRERSMRAATIPTRESVHDRLKWLMAEPEKSITDELIETRYRIYTQPGRPELMKKIGETLMKQGEDPVRGAELTDSTIMRRIQCPTLVVWSNHNPGRSAAEAEVSAREIPNHRMIVLKNSAHWPQWEEHELFNEQHIRFLLS